MHKISIASLAEKIKPAARGKRQGNIVAAKGPLLTAQLPLAAIGDICAISRSGRPPLLAQIVSFENELSFLAPYDDINGISPNAEVICEYGFHGLMVSEALIGQVIDPFGNPFDYNGCINSESRMSRAEFEQLPPNPMQRKAVNQQMITGIKSIDLFLPLGHGQRIGMFAGPGTGKSTLLGMIARNCEVDLSVIALVGERGREVREFLNDTLGLQGRKRSIIVVSTCDQSPQRRLLAALSATAIAEHFRANGRKVLLLVDSLTRVARAIRDVGLAAGELPLRQGYTPSVFSQLPRLFERAGNSDCGSITAVYTVLTQGEQHNDALAEEIKSLLDGHIVLDQYLAGQGIRPAIDILNSVSRLKSRLQNETDREVCDKLLRLQHRIRKDKEILLFGGQPDSELEKALKIEGNLNNLLSQNSDEKISLEESRKLAHQILLQYGNL